MKLLPLQNLLRTRVSKVGFRIIIGINRFLITVVYYCIFIDQDIFMPVDVVFKSAPRETPAVFAAVRADHLGRPGVREHVLSVVSPDGKLSVANLTNIGLLLRYATQVSKVGVHIIIIGISQWSSHV